MNEEDFKKQIIQDDLEICKEAVKHIFPIIYLELNDRITRKKVFEMLSSFCENKLVICDEQLNPPNIIEEKKLVMRIGYIIVTFSPGRVFGEAKVIYEVAGIFETQKIVEEYIIS